MPEVELAAIAGVRRCTEQLAAWSAAQTPNITAALVDVVDVLGSMRDMVATVRRSHAAAEQLHAEAAQVAAGIGVQPPGPVPDPIATVATHLDAALRPLFLAVVDGRLDELLNGAKG